MINVNWLNLWLIFICVNVIRVCLFFFLCGIRYKREEVKIQAWENHEKRKAEMEMKKMEVRCSV